MELADAAEPMAEPPAASEPAADGAPADESVQSDPADDAPAALEDIDISASLEASLSRLSPARLWKAVFGTIQLANTLFEAVTLRGDVRESIVAVPIVAIHSHYKLGKVWQHGEVLLVYRVGDAHRLDVFDRVATASRSALKSAFLSSVGRQLMEHHIRAFEASAARGYQLDRRRCHEFLDLSNVTPPMLNEAIAAVVRAEHGKGFSYSQGAHCQGFSNTLFAELTRRFGRESRPEVVRMQICCSLLDWAHLLGIHKPRLTTFLRKAYPRVLEDLTAQEQKAKADAKAAKAEARLARAKARAAAKRAKRRPPGAHVDAKQRPPDA